MTVCKSCHTKFEVTDKDQNFYRKIAVPEPTLCPTCRMQRRLSFRNERKLYSNKCGLCGKPVIAAYPPDSKFPIYCSSCWWSDKWDRFQYGADIDFKRPFFEQILELINKVPHQAVNSHESTSVNSNYTHCTSYLKNCYLLFGSNYNEDCLYGNLINHSKDICDSYMVDNSELLYECLECDNCYDLNFSKNCRTCRDSSFLINCRNVKNSFGCVNLLNKEYCIFNKQFTKEEYEKEILKYKLESPQRIDKLFLFVRGHLVKFPQKYMLGDHNENVTGDSVSHSKNSFSCFDATHLEDCSYSTWLHSSKDCYDIYAWGFTAELCYECVEVGDHAYKSLFCITCYGCSDVSYSLFDMHCKNLFGCVGLKKEEFCILNKKYSEKEYFVLKEKLISHMVATGEYGEFFPVELSPSPYSDTVASDYFPKM